MRAAENFDAQGGWDRAIAKRKRRHRGGIWTRGA
jgi:hypothetical protein